MSEAPSNSFGRIVSSRLFFRPALLPATLCAFGASVCLVGVILCAGGIAALVPSATGIVDVTQDDGILPAVATDSFPEHIVHAIVSRIPLLQRAHSALLVLSIACVALLALRWLLLAGANTVTARYAAGRVRRHRQHIHRQSLRLNPGELSGEGTLATRRLFRDTTDSMESAAHHWASGNVISAWDLGALILMVGLVHLRAGLECMIPVVACWYILRLEQERHAASADLLTEQADRSLNRLAAGLQKSRIVSGYGMESFEHDRFEENLQGFSDRRRAMVRQRRRGQWTSRFIMMFCVGVPAYLLMRHILAGIGVGLPSAVMIALCLVFIYRSLNALKAAGDQEASGNVAAEEIEEYIRRVPAVSQTVGARFLEPMTRTLQFDQICFDTPEHPGLLNNLDLRIDAGRRVALISLRDEETDALASLVPRFNDPYGGRVLIDGHDISRATLESLRAEAMIVSGSDNLFNASVLENVTCGQDEISRQQAMEAGKVAHAEKFVRQLAKGYETQIGEYGAQLDAGQAFRLALARAIARKPALLFIEEPRVALDTETKALLDDTYDRICADRTVVFLPYRLSTVKKCRRIVLLHEGCVAADGTHEELMRTSELYRHWEYVRFNAYRSGEV